MRFDYDPDLHTITAKRLSLRPFSEQDADRVAQLAGNPQLQKTVLALPYPYTRQNALDWIATHREDFESDSRYEMAVVLKESGLLIGCMGLMCEPAHRRAELGYWIGQPYWGQGYATEAAQAIIRFGFEIKNLHRIDCTYFSSNPASGRVMQKCGMEYEGTRKDFFLKDGRFLDGIFYGLVRPQSNEV